MLLILLVYWFLLLAVLGLAILIQFIVAKKFEKIAFQKGYDVRVHSFAMCFWLGIIGYLYVIALPNLTVYHNPAQERMNTANAPITEEQPQVQAYKCPKCKVMVQYGVNFCPNCRHVFHWKE